MIEGKRVLALIPARGGSKGIPGKNVYPVKGKPLIAYTIEAAKGSQYIDSIVVSTDHEEIAEVSRDYGAWIPFMRPEILATDTSKTIDAICDAIEHLKEMGHTYDLLILLQPTSPLRLAEDIDRALEQLLRSEWNSLVSVSEVSDPPVLIRTIGHEGLCQPLLQEGSTVRRQDMRKYYRVNGCIYINYCTDITKDTSLNDNQAAFIMPKERSLDIDEPEDLAMFCYYLERRL